MPRCRLGRELWRRAQLTVGGKARLGRRADTPRCKGTPIVWSRAAAAALPLPHCEHSAVRHHSSTSRCASARNDGERITNTSGRRSTEEHSEHSGAASEPLTFARSLHLSTMAQQQGKRTSRVLDRPPSTPRRCMKVTRSSGCSRDVNRDDRHTSNTTQSTTKRDTTLQHINPERAHTDLPADTTHVRIRSILRAGKRSPPVHRARDRTSSSFSNSDDATIIYDGLSKH